MTHPIAYPRTLPADALDSVPASHWPVADASEAMVGTGAPGATEGQSAWALEAGSSTLLGGTYRPIRQLASGGMGEIYLATHERLPGLFAVKMLQAALSATPAILDRFRREAEMMATLRHPHIAQVVDYNVTPGGRPYLVMEYIEGADLAEVARQQGPMSPALAADFLRQTASALAAAHAQGIVHLDLKPENVMVLVNEDNTPFVKVIDFGIAKSLRSRPTPGGSIIGTPEYMSPEQIDGRIEALDGRSDQFSLAVMTYFLLTGHSPWGADEQVTMLYRICHEPPQSLANYVSLYLPQLEGVLRKAMSKDPAERFPSVMEFSRAFDEAVAWESASAPPPVPDPLGEDFFARDSLAATVVQENEDEDADQFRVSRRHPYRSTLGPVALAIAAGLVVSVVRSPQSPTATASQSMVQRSAREAASATSLILRGAESRARAAWSSAVEVYQKAIVRLGHE